MKKMELVQMEGLEGGKATSDNCMTATGFMCTLGGLMLFSGVFAPIAVAPGIGCAIGLYAC